MSNSYLAPLLLPRSLLARMPKVSSEGNLVNDILKDPAVETLMLVPSERCNLKCDYCYERRKDPQRMDIQTAKRAVQEAFLRLKSGNRLKIEFRGGEPFLEFPFIRELCNWTIANYPKGSFFFYAVTNGTCFTDEAKSWLRKYKEIFVAPLSIDGARDTQNRNRCGSFDHIDFDFIFSTWSHPYTYTTMLPENAGNIFEDLRFLIEKGFEIRVNAEFVRQWTSAQLEELAVGLRRLADHVIKNRITCRINLFSRSSFFSYESHLENCDNDGGRKRLLICNAGKLRRIVAADGKIYPCHTFMPSAFNMEVRPTNVNLFEKLKSEDLHPPQCCACRFFLLCHICPGFSYSHAGDFKWRNPSICSLTKIRAFLGAYFWGMSITKNTTDIPLGDAQKILSKIADLYRGEKVYD